MQKPQKFKYLLKDDNIAAVAETLQHDRKIIIDFHWPGWCRENAFKNACIDATNSQYMQKQVTRETGFKKFQ